MSNNETSPEPSMSREDIAFYTKALWAALLKPNGTRSDLIDLGMEVLTKTPLSKISPKKFERLLPFLSQAAEDFAQQARSRMISEFETFVLTLERAQSEKIEGLEKIMEYERNEYKERLASYETQLKTLEQKNIAEQPTTEQPVTEPTEAPNG